MNTVAIAGVGLIGASFGLALRANGFGGEILGVSSPAALEAGLATGAITGTAELRQAAETADLVYLAQPVDRILETIEMLGPMLGEHTLVTDAGSTKEVICQQAARYLPRGRFLGGHPMAGKEQRGAQAADGDLFRARPYVLTPEHSESGCDMHDRFAQFRGWLRRIGAQLREMTAEEHDRTVAFTSHLPQLVSTALGLALARSGRSPDAQVFGTGLIDMTRLTASAGELWAPILRTNRVSIAAALRIFSSSLNDLQHQLESGDLEDSFRVAADYVAEMRRAPRGE